MKKFLLLAGVASLLSVNAQAEVNQYVSGKISYDFNKVNMKVAEPSNPELSREKANKGYENTHSYFFNNFCILCCTCFYCSYELV